MFGWAGRILKVDLTKGTLTEEPTDPKLTRRYIGGRGVSMRLLWDQSKPINDPFSPDNVLIFGTGPLVGTASMCTGRFNVSVRKSPMNMSFGDSNAGGHWAPELKFAGYDHIVVHGRSSKPVYLWISDGHAELRDASHLWGLTTWETTDIIKEENRDPEVHVAGIGPGGENLVRYACVISDYVRAQGRTGTGAVMGSKNLKSIAVRGTLGVKIADPEEYEKVIDEVWNKVWKSTGIKEWSKYGTQLLINWANPGGYFTTRNFQTGTFEEADKIMIDHVWPRYFSKDKGCFACPIHCTGLFRVNEGPFKGLMCDKVEFNTSYAFGSNLGNSYFPAIMKASELCSKYGVNNDGTAFSISLAMDCYEKGILTKKDTDGLDLTWGNYDAALKFIEKIARREGLGDILAEGPKRAAEKIGKGAEKLQHTVKGMPLYGDMRTRKGWALAYVVSTRGPDHLRGASNLEFKYGFMPLEAVQKIMGKDVVPESGTINPLSLKGKGPLLAWTENYDAVIDCIGICRTVSYWSSVDRLGYKEISRLLSTVTGWNVSETELMHIGERIYNLERTMNAVDGITRRDEVLPPSQFQPLPTGPKKGEKIDPEELEKAKTEYYRARGWNEESGLPTTEKLRKLGLEDLLNNRNVRSVLEKGGSKKD